MKCFGVGTERGTSRYLGEGEAILILEAMFDTLRKFMIKEIRKARIGAEHDWHIVKKVKRTKPCLGRQITEGHV